MFESSSKNRKSWNGRQMVWQWIPNTWSNMKMIWKLPWWFYVEERIMRKTKKSGVLVPVHILGWEMKDRMVAETGVLWKLTVAILKLILWRTGSQCKSERTGGQNRGFCATTRARVFWTRWRRVRFETDVPMWRDPPDSSVSSLILVGWCEEGHPATKNLLQLSQG